MQSKEVAIHVVFVAFLIMVCVFAIGLSSVWEKLDATAVLRVLIISQVILTIAFSISLWRATLLWIRVNPAGIFGRWPLRMPKEESYAPAGRWRRAAILVWLAMMANLAVFGFFLAR